MIKSVRPKDSGSVLVVRQGDEGIEVLMGRRGASAVFGGFWVFPGGKVDRSDRYPRPAHDLTAQILGKLSQDSIRARAFAMAAVRETFEETGLMIAAPDVVALEHELMFECPPGCAGCGCRWGWRSGSVAATAKQACAGRRLAEPRRQHKQCCSSPGRSFRRRRRRRQESESEQEQQFGCRTCQHRGEAHT